MQRSTYVREYVDIIPRNFIDKYNDQYKINSKIAKLYSYKIQNNMSKPLGSLADDKYYLGVLLENITESNYKNVYFQLIRNNHSFLKITFDILIESLFNGQIIDYKIRMLELINDDVETIAADFIKSTIQERNDKKIQFLAEIFVNILNQDLLDFLLNEQKNNVLFSIYLNTKNDLVKKYIKTNSHRIVDEDIQYILI